MFLCLFLLFFFSIMKRIGHFRVHLTLHFKARLSAKSLLWKSDFIHIEIGTNYHNKNFALTLALKERLRGTRKWPIQETLNYEFSVLDIAFPQWPTKQWSGITILRETGHILGESMEDLVRVTELNGARIGGSRDFLPYFVLSLNSYLVLGRLTRRRTGYLTR